MAAPPARARTATTSPVDASSLVDTSRFDLHVALEALMNDRPDQQAELEAEEHELAQLRQEVVDGSKANFALDRELDELDRKIQLLVQNRLTHEEVMLATGVRAGDEEDKVSPIRGIKVHYEELFFLLQSKPKYFATLARLVKSVDVPNFVETVVFDMYGDQYDTREERLLLELFRRVLSFEFERSQATGAGSFMRANTCISKMLSAYARRGLGFTILRDILEEPLKALVKDRELNLEVDARKVYLQMRDDHETRTGEAWDRPSEVTAEEAIEFDDVRAEVERRVERTKEICRTILRRIYDGVDTVPYGMRWVCKQLGNLAREHFPDAGREQADPLIGGYINLRFFNPVIVAPDSVNFTKKPSKVQRNNLILVAKVLQALSNGVTFRGGAKESKMLPFNEFLAEQKPLIQDYFDRLVAVDDLGEVMALDKYLEHSVRLNHIRISLNHIFLVHRLLQQHVDEVAPDENDPIRRILGRLGDAHDALPRDEDREIILNLADRREVRLSTSATNAFVAPDVNPLYFQAKTLLLNVLRLLPSETDQRHLFAFLQEQEARARKEHDDVIAKHIADVQRVLRTLAAHDLLPKHDTEDETFDAFLWEVAKEALDRKNRLMLVRKRLDMVNQALHTIRKHHEYLMERKDLYHIYLQNVRGAPSAAKPSGKKDKNADKKKKKTYKISHNDLVSKGIIIDVDDSLPRTILKKCQYTFEQVSPGRFQITVAVKKGITINLLKKPFVVVLEDLLQKKAANERELQMDQLTLNVNLLIHLINKKF